MASVCIEDRDLDEVVGVDVYIEFVLPLHTGGRIQSSIVQGRKILYIPDDPLNPQSVDAVVTQALNEAMNRGATKVALTLPRREWTRDIYELEAVDVETLTVALTHPINSIIVAAGYNRQQVNKLRKLLLG